MTDISISIPGEEAKTVAAGITAQEALKELLSKKQRKQAVAVLCNGEATDLSATLQADTVLELIQADSDEGTHILRHSTAHIMAQAVKELFGQDVKVAIGPSIEDGYYYDFDRDPAFNPDDFVAIEERMAEIVKARLPFERRMMPIAEALAFFADQGESYKVELLKDLEEKGEEAVSLYQQGDFIDLCRGPHIPDTSWLKSFKLLRVAGSYWRGDERNPMLTRIYGTAFSDKKDLRKYLNRIEEAKKRDHRKLGKELALFTIQDEVGPGLILWQPRGALLRKLIEDYWKDAHYKNGYELLYTPHIARQDLWKTSGHLDFYGENMYSAIEIDEVAYQLKPMNCPFHIG
ncbi:MAG: threonine--tRNA ligase, partial [Candidatus Electrothrix sp. AR5]|nr:threonine--tRNA ligase [Candidatus Electrothrix sp. AR5]